MTPNNFPNGMDFMKQFWQQGAASTAAPQSASPSPAFTQAMGQYMMPTFDLEELDKRIADMRTVLQFMELNTNLLRQSLNTLEVQRNTVATLQSMTKPAAPHDNSATSTESGAANAAAAPWLAAWQSMMQAAVPTATTATPAAQSGSQSANSPKPATVRKKSAPRKTTLKSSK
jgi:hypothetical protein